MLDYLTRRIPDPIFLDLSLPYEDGFDVLRSIRIKHRYDAVPVVFISDSDAVDVRIKDLEPGGRRVPGQANQHRRTLRPGLHQVKLKLDQIFEEYKRLLELSLTDPLIGTYNQRTLDTFLKFHMAWSPRHEIPVSCLKFNIDHFKDVSGSNGHDAGNRVIVEITSLIRLLCRQEDAVIRYGGEEFLIGYITRQRKVPPRFVSVSDRMSRTTISTSTESHPEDTADPKRMIKLANDRLYAVKNDGCNRVEDHGDFTR